MKTGYHAVYENGYFDAIDSARANGFDFVQIDLGVPTFFLDHLCDAALSDIGSYARDRGVGLTFHAPGDNVSLYCDYPIIRRGILDQFRYILDRVNRLEARHITFHAGLHSTFKQSGRTADDFTLHFADHYHSILYENIEELLRSTQSTLICFENDHLDAPTMRTLDALIGEGKNLYLALDTAKVYDRKRALDRDVLGFMIGHGDSIREIHVHDLSDRYGAHQIVGEGIVNFHLFEDFLFRDDIYMNYEVRPVEAAKISRQRILEMFHSNDRDPDMHTR